VTPEAVLPTYQRHAAGFARSRDLSLFERGWLERMCAAAPGPRVLDLGCGPGAPIGAYLARRGCRLTGVDGAPAMLALYRAALPGAETVRSDMRALALGRRFDAILAWNSFFHLSMRDQRAMFPVFAAHAVPGAALMFTSGPEECERIGAVEGARIFHASLAPAEYRALLVGAGFEPVAFVPEDPACRGHSVWLARRRG
jgi:SAM-dependent methyltransferase